MQFDGTVQEAEQLFATEYWHYQHTASGSLRLACDDYSLPEHVQQHVDFAMPTVQLDGLQPVANVDRALMAPIPGGAKIGSRPCGELVTVECLRGLYSFPAGNSSAADNQMGIGEWADYLYEEDLPAYFRNFTSPEIPADTRPEFIAIDGGLGANLTTVSQGSGVESALDFQAAYSIIYPQKLRLYQVGDGINVDSVGTCEWHRQDTVSERDRTELAVIHRIVPTYCIASILEDRVLTKEKSTSSWTRLTQATAFMKAVTSLILVCGAYSLLRFSNLQFLYTERINRRAQIPRILIPTITRAATKVRSNAVALQSPT